MAQQADTDKTKNLLGSDRKLWGDDNVVVSGEDTGEWIMFDPDEDQVDLKDWA